jgi:hypothetical protein
MSAKWIVGIDPGLDGGIVMLSGDRQDAPLTYAMPTIEVRKKRSPVPKRKPGEPDGAYERRKYTVSREYDLETIWRRLKGIVGEIADVHHGNGMVEIAHVFIERQQAMSKPVPERCRKCGTVMGMTTPQGAVSIFSHGRGYGLLEGMVKGIGIPYTIVHTLSWQNTLTKGLGGDSKARAHLTAMRLFPGLDLRASEKSRRPHEGIIDALLIAEFGRRQLHGSIEPDLEYQVREPSELEEEEYEPSLDDVGF